MAEAGFGVGADFWACAGFWAGPGLWPEALTGDAAFLACVEVFGVAGLVGTDLEEEARAEGDRDLDAGRSKLLVGWIKVETAER